MKYEILMREKGFAKQLIGKGFNFSLLYYPSKIGLELLYNSEVLKVNFAIH